MLPQITRSDSPKLTVSLTHEAPPHPPPIGVRRASITILTPLAPLVVAGDATPVTDNPTLQHPGLSQRDSLKFRSPSPYPQPAQLLASPSLEGNPSETPSSTSVSTVGTAGGDTTSMDSEHSSHDGFEELEDGEHGEGSQNVEDGARQRPSAASGDWLELTRRSSILDIAKSCSGDSMDHLVDPAHGKGNLSALLEYWACEGTSGCLLSPQASQAEP